MPPRKRTRGATQPDISNADDAKNDAKNDTQNDDTQSKHPKRAKKGSKVDVKAEDDDDLTAPPPKTSKRGKSKTKADNTKTETNYDDEDAQKTVSKSISISQSEPDRHVIADLFFSNVIKAQKNDAQKARNAHLTIPIDEGCPYPQGTSFSCKNFRARF
jgi:hypothetical protein